VRVRTQVRTCHCSSLRAVFTLVAAWLPLASLNRHDGRPCGFWIFHCPPRVADWPFWMMLPKFSLVRNRISMVKVPVPGS
jgi:hypothetical protein